MKNQLKHLLLFGVVTFLFTACGHGPRIVIPSYTAPKEASKLKQIETKDEFIAKGAYLAIWLNPDIKGADKANSKLRDMLIGSVKSAITQTNFIALDPLGEDDGVALNMEVVSYDYKKGGDKVSLYLKVTFVLARGVNEFLVKSYDKRLVRSSSDPSRLPTEDQLASEAVNKIVKYFISDISPLKTYQMREFKPLPSALEAVVAFAKRKNYKGAVSLMEEYDGEKDANYYYNLAILYEAMASETEDLSYLKSAKKNYNKALLKGGGKDKTIIDAKARFDRFFDLLNRTKKVQKNNSALLKDRNSMVESSDSEYE